MHGICVVLSDPNHLLLVSVLYWFLLVSWESHCSFFYLVFSIPIHVTQFWVVVASIVCRLCIGPQGYCPIIAHPTMKPSHSSLRAGICAPASRSGPPNLVAFRRSLPKLFLFCTVPLLWAPSFSWSHSFSFSLYGARDWPIPIPLSPTPLYVLIHPPHSVFDSYVLSDGRVMSLPALDCMVRSWLPFFVSPLCAFPPRPVLALAWWVLWKLRSDCHSVFFCQLCLPRQLALFWPFQSSPSEVDSGRAAAMAPLGCTSYPIELVDVARPLILRTLGVIWLSPVLFWAQPVTSVATLYHSAHTYTIKIPFLNRRVSTGKSQSSYKRLFLTSVPFHLSAMCASAIWVRVWCLFRH